MRELAKKVSEKARNASKVRVIENFTEVKGTSEEKLAAVIQLLNTLDALPPEIEWEIDEIGGPVYSMTIVHPEGWLAIEIQ